jgi:hypothetical protein
MGKQGAEVSTEYGGLSRREHQRQLIGESLPLSLNDGVVFLDLFRAIVQQTAYSAQGHVSGM